MRIYKTEMTSSTDTLQRITILTSLTDILSRLDALVSPAAVSAIAPEEAFGATFAADFAAPADFPQQDCALSDGWAVAAEQTADASSFAPVVLEPAPAWVNAGDFMPAGADAVLLPDSATVVNGKAEIHLPATQGDGVLPARSHVSKGAVLRKAGERVRQLDVAVIRSLAVETISVRAPRVRILSVSVSQGKSDSSAPMIAHAVRAVGGRPEIVSAAPLEMMLSKPECDLLIVIGGTGSGKNDTTLKSAARLGKVEFHGFGILPGQMAALGAVDRCPLLMLPGRLDSALAAFLLVGSKIVARLAGSTETDPASPVFLSKKVTSTIGLAEVVFVRRVEKGIEPLGSGMFSLQALSQADGWIFIPPGSEGIAAGTTVEMRSLP